VRLFSPKRRRITFPRRNRKGREVFRPPGPYFTGAGAQAARMTSVKIRISPSGEGRQDGGEKNSGLDSCGPARARLDLEALNPLHTATAQRHNP